LSEREKLQTKEKKEHVCCDEDTTTSRHADFDILFIYLFTHKFIYFYCSTLKVDDC